jgi:hypothetical protein
MKKSMAHSAHVSNIAPTTGSCGVIIIELKQLIMDTGNVRVNYKGVRDGETKRCQKGC